MALDVSNLTSTVQAPVNFVYMRGLLSAAKKVLPFFNGTLPGKLEKAGGSMSVKWRRIENLAPVTTALSEHTENGPAVFGLGRSTVKPTVTDVTKAIAKFGNAILLTEEVDLFNINSNTMSLMETLGANAGESLNATMRVEYDNATNVRYASNAANKSAVVAEMKANDIKWAVNKLNRENAQVFTSMATGSRNITTSTVRSSFYGICHPDVEEDIRNITGFVGVEQYGGYTETLVGEFGAVNGVRWVATTIAPIETGAGTTSTSNTFRGTSVDTNDLYTSYVYGKEAIGSIGLGNEYPSSTYVMYENKPQPIELIVHKPGSSGVADLYNEIGSIAWKAWFGGKILNGNWVVKIVTLAKDLGA
jgi:N4-gp56 family major capsid protein